MKKKHRQRDRKIGIYIRRSLPCPSYLQISFFVEYITLNLVAIILTFKV
jgi:hypothetical protein